MAKVTIVVPIYKVEKYLRACFESLLKQTSIDFVVMAINDGSPDGCEAIIKEYCKEYPGKIVGLYKPNGGYGSVLKLAIQEMKTPYFLVCDPDDTLEPDAVKTLLELAEVSHANLIVGAKNIVMEGSTKKEYDAAYNQVFVELKNKSVYHREESDWNDLFFIDPSPHAKLYMRELCKDIHFPDHVGYTDNMLFYLTLLKCQTVMYTKKALANYLIDRTGNTMTDVSYKAMNGQILVFKGIATQATKQSDIPEIFWYRLFESFKFMLYQTRRMNCEKAAYEETLNYLETYLKLLLPYNKQIKTYYKKYSKTKVLERMRDMALIQPKRSTSTFEGLKKKMLQEYKG